MWISRIRATGGFLSGLDLELQPGLNVIVGPRGSGKTTLLELVRHALSLAETASPKERQISMRHALGAGEVTLDVEFSDESRRLIVDAAGGGRVPGLTGTRAVMLGQNELESIADNARRRLALVDLRAGLERFDESASLEELGVLSVHRLRSVERVQEIRDLLRTRQSLSADKARLAAREAELLSEASSDLASKRSKLAEVEADLLQSQQVQSATAGLLIDAASVYGIANQVAVLAARFGLSAPVTLQPAVERGRERLVDLGLQADRVARALTADAQRHQQEAAERELQLRAHAEPLRSELEAAEAGLGSTTAELRNIDAQLARLVELDQELAHLETEVAKIDQRRDTIHRELEQQWELRFATRERVAREISEALGHRVQISVSHLSDSDAFEKAMAESLQGSGLKYGALSEALARDLLPFVLLRYVEGENVKGLAHAANIPEQRADRVIQALKTEHGVMALASAHLSDSVDFKLQDGAVLKSVADLSTGQKCAATLPIVLTDNTRLVILDQPEDHLDNQFLVGTVIESLIRRTEAGAQTVVATHNPNIPVLGSASLVAYLKSDGSHGAVIDSGPFDLPSVVETITNLMEGGRDAFDARVAFYRSHDLP